MIGDGFFRDVSQGGVSALACTLTTNGLLHWQFCQIKKRPFYPTDAWRGFGANFLSYAGFLTVAHLTKGSLARVCDRLGYEDSDKREFFLGMAAGLASPIGVVSGERLAALDNAQDKGTRRLIAEVWKRSGWRGFTHGLAPTMARDVVAVAGVVTWGRMLRDRFTQGGMNEYLATASSSVAVGTGVVAVTQPAQVLRLVMQSSSQDLSLRGAWKKLYRADQPVLKRIAPFWAGTPARIVINVVLVATSTLVEDSLAKYF